MGIFISYYHRPHHYYIIMIHRWRKILNFTAGI